MAGQNLFLISFENEDDMEIIMEGRPWFFRRQLIIFARLVEPIKKNGMAKQSLVTDQLSKEDVESKKMPPDLVTNALGHNFTDSNVSE
ncbi:hypothetical protein PVK06_012873 [Gossypium arboreum]|uniref:DUF4283 domain-containing protein n=1 Tax=Gossypium arboreum TaxID=29729 RepID=A0ABR0QDN4_GOSAR|nr:hypothetical protein PVK06_012873 [Gossypium arboreum]